jgi:DNA-binding NtrC family response regulator
MVAYLARSGHDAERAFANSFGVYRGALETLLARTVYGFRPEQFTCELRSLRGTFLLHLREENRFHYENLIEILLGHVRRLRERQEPEARPAAGEGDVHLSTAMKEAWARLRKAAASDETVLLCGESGTGKSYYARVLHDLGARRDGPFVEVGLTSEVGTDNLIQSNLFGHVRGAFTGADEEKQGLFALADGGTIFLDEIGDASPELQAKLLRVIEKKTFKMLGGVRDLAVDVRILAATNQDIASRAREGRFREDLYYRLNVIRIPLPPLRERREDLPALVGRLFGKVCRDARKPDKQLSAAAFQLLCAHGWPGNVRELENALRHAVALSDESAILPGDLPEALRSAPAGPEEQARPPLAGGDVINTGALRRAIASAPPSPELKTFECQAHIDYAKREYLKALIDHYRGDISQIARHWDRSSENTLLKLIRELGLEEHLRAARKARQ